MHYGYIGLGNLGGHLAHSPRQEGLQGHRLRPRPETRRAPPERRCKLGGDARRARLQGRCRLHLPPLAHRLGKGADADPHHAEAGLDLDRELHQRPRRDDPPCGHGRGQGHQGAGSPGDRRRAPCSTRRDHRARRWRQGSVRAFTARARDHRQENLPHGPYRLRRRSSRSSPTCWPSSTSWPMPRR